MINKALTTVITVQDGAFLAELLLAKGYQVQEVKRRASSLKMGRIDRSYQDSNTDDAGFKFHCRDLTDASDHTRVLVEIGPVRVIT